MATKRLWNLCRVTIAPIPQPDGASSGFLGVDEFSFEGLRKWSKLFLVPLENKLNNV